MEKIILQNSPQGKKVKSDDYCDDCLMYQVARFLEANNGKTSAPAELAAFFNKQKNHHEKPQECAVFL